MTLSHSANSALQSNTCRTSKFLQISTPAKPSPPSPLQIRSEQYLQAVFCWAIVVPQQQRPRTPCRASPSKHACSSVQLCTILCHPQYAMARWKSLTIMRSLVVVAWLKNEPLLELQDVYSLTMTMTNFIFSFFNILPRMPNHGCNIYL